MSNELSPIYVERLTKRFHAGAAPVTALAGVDLAIAPGDFVAVMGASGSGKSTLLHLMGGLTIPDEGRVVIDGQDLAKLRDHELTLFRRRRIGLVFQSLNLIPALTAEENVLLPLQAGGRLDGKVDIDDLFELLGLTQRRHHRPDALSGGEQQRVAIARALITDPAIVLADEPTGSLDSRNGQAICKLLRQLNETQRRTIVVVTHEPNVAIWANRVVVLKDGSVCSQFDTAEFDGPQALAMHYHELTDAEPIEFSP